MRITVTAAVVSALLGCSAAAEPQLKFVARNYYSYGLDPEGNEGYVCTWKFLLTCISLLFVAGTVDNKHGIASSMLSIPARFIRHECSK